MGKGCAWRPGGLLAWWPAAQPSAMCTDVRFPSFLVRIAHPALFQAVLPTLLEGTRSLGTLCSAGHRGQLGVPWLPLDSLP